MRYYKTVFDGIVTVSTLDADGEGNITEQEYNDICNLLINLPSDKVLIEDGDGYAYANAPTTDDISAEDALDILIGGE